MPEQPSFPIPAADADQTTGRYLVTFRDDAVTEGIAALRDAGVAALPNAADYVESAVAISEMEAAGGAVFPTLGVAVVTLDEAALTGLMSVAGDDAVILDVEPERMFYALGEGLSVDYLRGYRDAASHLYEKTAPGVAEEEVEAAVTFVDDAASTWGLKATKVVNSRWTGLGIRVAVLDTGMDLTHPDFVGRVITSQSFVPGEAVQDGHGHGTHCIGTACGRQNAAGRRYGVAGNSAIFAGKVLSNSGSGQGGWILAGMEWAINNQCRLISMSLGNTVATPSTAYENAGKRALQNGCLIVAAAGNHRTQPPPPFPRTVGQPANSPSIMAVGAVNNQLQLASFSCTSGSAVGSKVDLVAPGVAVYSSTKMPQRDATWNGTSMATPHVAGIGALWSQATGAQGSLLGFILMTRALGLQIPNIDDGAGLVQAPVP